MATLVYLLGAVVTFVCAVLLSRGYERSGKRLLLWSALCFAGLTLSNFLVFADLVLFRDIDLYPARLGTALVAMCLLLFGLIWER